MFNSAFGLSEKQADAILDISLRRITLLEVIILLFLYIFFIEF